MRPISDAIEDFIKAMMEGEPQQLELRRNELAQYFRCAPSQINYVLATRFTQDHGYVVESRRGGGGYIRIIRVSMTQDDYLTYLLRERIGERLSAAEADAIVQNLLQRGMITDRESTLMRAAVSPQALQIPLNIKDIMRAQIMRSMIQGLATRPKEEA